MLLLGSFKYGDIWGYTVLPILNYRASILVDMSGSVRVITNIPFKEWYENTLLLCSNLALRRERSLNPLDDAALKAMLYGGIGTFAVVDNEAHILMLDYIDNSKYWFYLKPGKLKRNVENYELGDLVLLHFALREGIPRIVEQVCRKLGEVEKPFICIMKSSHGELYITSTPVELGEEFLRIIPDNNPLRHVVAYTAKNAPTAQNYRDYQGLFQGL